MKEILTHSLSLVPSPLKPAVNYEDEQAGYEVDMKYPEPDPIAYIQNLVPRDQDHLHGRAQDDDDGNSHAGDREDDDDDDHGDGDGYNSHKEAKYQGKAGHLIPAPERHAPAAAHDHEEEDHHRFPHKLNVLDEIFKSLDLKGKQKSRIMHRDRHMPYHEPQYRKHVYFPEAMIRYDKQRPAQHDDGNDYYPRPEAGGTREGGREGGDEDYGRQRPAALRPLHHQKPRHDKYGDRESNEGPENDHEHEDGRRVNERQAHRPRHRHDYGEGNIGPGYHHEPEARLSNSSKKKKKERRRRRKRKKEKNSLHFLKELVPVQQEEEEADNLIPDIPDVEDKVKGFLHDPGIGFRSRRRRR